jgi:coproporphyrinogen III oxidase-like Fe-S oxidoreductase
MVLTSLLRIYLTRSLQPFRFKNTYTNHLDFENLNELGLYVHIPFCRSICSFCPYCKVIYDNEIAKRYKMALIKEIEIVGVGLKNKKAVTSLYFGGGTPSLMLYDLKDIIDCLKKYFIITQGIGVELHPDDINENTLTILKESSVTMVSVGIQSFNEKCLSALGRSDSDFCKKLELVKEAEFDVVDVDLIFAIPHQTEQILKEDIEKAFSYGATQISTYPFIDFTFANNLYKPMPEKVKKRMLNSIADYCKEINRERTSVWTFAKKNTEKYSSVTRDNFLGFGVSATTLLRNEFKINTFSIEDYIDRTCKNQLPTSLTLSFTKRQRAVYYLFWSAYSTRIYPEKYKAIISKSIYKMFGMEIWICQRLGFLEKRKDHFHISDKGAYYYHYLEQAYTLSYIDKMWNVSRITAFPKEIILK